MFLGMFDIIDFARFVARRIVFVGGFVSVCFVFGDEHGGAAARTAIIDAEPVLDALVVKNIALATSLSSRYDRVFGFEFFQANRATRAAVAGTVRAAANDPGTFDENTDRVTPPFIPETRDATSDATTGFFLTETFIN